MLLTTATPCMTRKAGKETAEQFLGKLHFTRLVAGARDASLMQCTETLCHLLQW